MASYAAWEATQRIDPMMATFQSADQRKAYMRNKKQAWMAEEARQNELRGISQALSYEREQGLKGYQDYLASIAASPEDAAARDYFQATMGGQLQPMDEQTQALMVARASAPIQQAMAAQAGGLREAYGAAGFAPGSQVTNAAMQKARLAGLRTMAGARMDALLAANQQNWQARAMGAQGLTGLTAARRAATLPAVQGMADFRANVPLAGGQGAKVSTPGQGYVQPFNFTPSQRTLV